MAQVWASGQMKYVYCTHCQKIQPYKVEFLPVDKNNPRDAGHIVCQECGHIACTLYEKTE